MNFGTKLRSLAIAAAAVALTFASPLGLAAKAQSNSNVEALQATPLADSPLLRGVGLSPVKPGALRVPTITWGGDVSTQYTEMEGIFKKEGLSVTLFNENDFAKQVKGLCSGDTPFLRGTFGMINAAAEAVKKCGTDLVVVNQLTWSRGGDALVVRPGIKNLADLKGKTIALQLYGPHMDLLTTILNRAGLKITDVKIVWLKELTPPSYDTKGKIVDARTAFKEDASIDAAFVISPDAAALTDNGTGSGAEGVKGATVLFSTKTADKVIADVYAVRADWFHANKATVEKFVHAQMVGQEGFANLLANKKSNVAAWQKLISASATLLFDSAQATSDVEGAIGDADFVGYDGNVSFFTAVGTTRNFNVLKDEIQKSFVDIKLLKGSASASVINADWDYTKLTAGLNNVHVTAVARPKFDANKVQQSVERDIATEVDAFQNGLLYQTEILFDLNQTEFDATRYAVEFKKVLELSQTFGGAAMVIEGHNGPELIAQMRAQGKSQQEIDFVEQRAKTLSLSRANKVRDAFIAYAKAQGIKLDDSQFIAVGLGVKSPKFPNAHTRDEAAQNRRVVFGVRNVETEVDVFKN